MPRSRRYGTSSRASAKLERRARAGAGRSRGSSSSQPSPRCEQRRSERDSTLDVAARERDATSGLGVRLGGREHELPARGRSGAAAA